MNETPPPVPVTLQVKTSALAVCALVFGILGVVLFCLGIPFAIAGVICGHMALSRIKNSGGLLTGGGLAIGGLSTGYAGIAMVILLSIIAAPNFVKARSVAQKNMCINNLRQIDAAKNEWALEHGKKAEDMPTVTDITPYLKNNQMPVCPAGGMYTIGADNTSPTCTIPSHVLPQ